MLLRKCRSLSWVAALGVAVLLAGMPTRAAATPVTIAITGSMSTTYLSPDFTPGFTSNYGVSGSIFGDVGASVFTISGGVLNLSGTGPDTIMNLTPGDLSFDGTSFFWDFGQGPFDIGVPTENPGYVLNNTGVSGTLGDMFGNVVVGGSFDAEGFGLAVNNSPTHSMSSFFWSGTVEERQGGPEPVPEPSTLLLLGTGLAGLIGYGRRRKV